MPSENDFAILFLAAACVMNALAVLLVNCSYRQVAERKNDQQKTPRPKCDVCGANEAAFIAVELSRSGEFKTVAMCIPCAQESSEFSRINRESQGDAHE